MAAIDELGLPRAAWRKSTHSNNGGDCVEVTGAGPTVAVRDSKNPDGPALTFTPEQWHSFIGQLAEGTFPGA